MKKINGLIIFFILFNVIKTPLTLAVKKNEPLKSKKVLIINTGSNKVELKAAAFIKTQLMHFNVGIREVLQKDYSKGLLENFDLVVYLGQKERSSNLSLIYDDVLKNSKQVIWVNKNIQGLLKRDDFGFEVNGLTEIIPFVSYKNTNSINSTSLSRIQINNSKTVKVLANASTKKTAIYPFMVKSRNLTYIANNPFKKPIDGSSYLIFCDYLHEVIIDHPPLKKALIRLEDIHPGVDIAQLRRVINYLYFNEIPFSIAVIPVFRESSDSMPVYASQRPDFVELLKYAKTKGATIVLHGYSHQINGTTGVDAEFWDMVKKKPINNIKDTKRRVKLAIREMEKIGVKPDVWETPHYAAGTKTRQTIAEFFKKTYERQGEYGELSTPYYIPSNQYGQKVIPETLGYFGPSRELTIKNINDKLSRIKVVRDGYASFFFHYFRPINDLKKIIKEIKKQKYKFISAKEVLNEKFNIPAKPTNSERIMYAVDCYIAYLGSYLFIVILFFVSYYLIVYGLSRKYKDKIPKNNSDLLYIFIIPALNEEKVIRKTVENLLSVRARNFLVMVIDDHSQDNTLSVLKSIKSKKLRIMERKLPNAQLGKGEALNYAYQKILEMPEIKKYDQSDVIISIVDGDGCVDKEIIRCVNPYFDQIKVGAVQTTVRIDNYKQNLLTRWQDFEFSVFCKMFQSARQLLGSVGLGGNGQFIRLSALSSLGENPWNSCLTEDLDIGIRLLLGGWRNSYCKSTYVVQQAVPSFKALIKQRTRWFQGHISCWRYLPTLSNSNLPLEAKIDISYYLLSIALTFFIVPSNFFLIISFIYVLFASKFSFLVFNPAGFDVVFKAYLFHFGALPIIIFVYWNEKKSSIISTIFLAHLYLLVSAVWLLAGYAAIYRLIFKKKKWVKTQRISYVEDIL